MSGERLPTIDKGTLLAEQMLCDREILYTTASGIKKEAILQQIVSQLDNDSVAQAAFLRTLFQNISKEGELEVTNRRDGALAILTDQAIQPIMKANPFVLHDSYIEAIRQQTVQNDPVSGSIDTLLEAGKAIAPHLPSDLQARRQIADEWEAVAGQFPTIDDRFHIRSKLKEIKQRMYSTSVFGIQVAQLRIQGLTNRQIAEELGRELTDIEHSARRLIAAGRIERRKGGTPVIQAVINLDIQVEKLRKDGLTNSQIAKKLGKEPVEIKNSAHRLIAAGRIEPAPRGKRVTEAIINLDIQVEQLKKIGFSRSQIGKELGIKASTLTQSLRRLIAAGRIEPDKRGRKPKALVQ